MALTRSEVIEGALHLLDQVGLDALTMRRLADALDVKAGAIYWHFADKQDLHDAMGDELTAGLLEPPPRGRWDAQLGELSRRLATGLLRRRDGARLALKVLRPGPNTLAMGEAFLRVAARAGRPPDVTLLMTAVLGYYVTGWVSDIQAQEAAKSHGLKSLVRAFRRELDVERYPRLASISARRIDQLLTRRDARSRFEFGLTVILNGIKATKKSRAPSSRR